MRTLPLLAALLASTALPALAQSPAPAQPAAPAPAATPAQPAEDTIVARVDGQPVRMSEVMATAAEALPEQMRNIPPEALRALLPPEIMRQLIERTVTDRAMVAAARREGLDRDAELRRRVAAYEDNELRDALLRREVLPRVTDEAVRARYDRDQQGRPAEEELRARHILVNSEADARAALQEIQRGASFEDVARRRSQDPAARQGGDLGFFKRGVMMADFEKAAFTLPVGGISEPIRTKFGWHVLKVEERRALAAPPLEEVKDKLREAMLRSQLEKYTDQYVQELRAGAVVDVKI